MTVPLIKICGITSKEDARVAITAGADWLGFIFVPQSPRALSRDIAKPILTEIKQEFPHVQLVGVFQNASPEEIKQHLATLPLDVVQLHGDEIAAEFSELNATILKVLLLKPDASVEHLHQQATSWLQLAHVKAVLLDLPKGSGLQSILEWPAFPELSTLVQELPCVVAGGLNLDNVSDVIRALNPLGVDVASGVEQSPGKKDIDCMQAFCQAVKIIEPQTENGESISCNC